MTQSLYLPSGFYLEPKEEPFNVPSGWMRGAAIRYAATELAAAQGLVAIIFPHHHMDKGMSLYHTAVKLRTIALHDAWKHWWFSGPIIPPNVNLPFNEKSRYDAPGYMPLPIAHVRMPKEGESASFLLEPTPPAHIPAVAAPSPDWTDGWPTMPTRTPKAPDWGVVAKQIDQDIVDLASGKKQPGDGSASTNPFNQPKKNPFK